MRLACCGIGVRHEIHPILSLLCSVILSKAFDLRLPPGGPQGALGEGGVFAPGGLQRRGREGSPRGRRGGLGEGEGAPGATFSKLKEREGERRVLRSAEEGSCEGEAFESLNVSLRHSKHVHQHHEQRDVGVPILAGPTKCAEDP